MLHNIAKLPVQKVKHLYLEEAKRKPAHLGHEYIITPKHDGWYGYMDFPECKIRSRAGREIPSLEWLSNKLRGMYKRISSLRGRLIFEILLTDVEEFSELNGILNRKYESADNAYLVVHDFVAEWNPNIIAGTRLEMAREVVNVGKTGELVDINVLNISSDPDVWRRHVEDVWDNDGEGVICKRRLGIYTPDTKNYDLMKIKKKITTELLVVDWEYGRKDSKYKDTVGTLTCTDKAGRIYNISGMSDFQRHEWFGNFMTIKGEVVEVEAMERSSKGKLREPRFKAIRFDKHASEID